MCGTFLKLKREKPAKNESTSSTVIYIQSQGPPGWGMGRQKLGRKTSASIPIKIRVSSPQQPLEKGRMLPNLAKEIGCSYPDKTNTEGKHLRASMTRKRTQKPQHAQVRIASSSVIRGNWEGGKGKKQKEKVMR